MWMDVAFLRALIDKLEYEYAVDPKSVFVTGMSNGGMMAYRMGCAAADKIAAIAPVAGSLDIECNPSAPVSVFAFHGTADENVPYEGGTGKKQIDGPRDEKPVSYAIGLWVKRDGCKATPAKTEQGTLRTDSYSRVAPAVLPSCSTPWSVRGTPGPAGRTCFAALQTSPIPPCPPPP